MRGWGRSADRTGLWSNSLQTGIFSGNSRNAVPKTRRRQSRNGRAATISRGIPYEGYQGKRSHEQGFRPAEQGKTGECRGRPRSSLPQESRQFVSSATSTQRQRRPHEAASFFASPNPQHLVKFCQEPKAHCDAARRIEARKTETPSSMIHESPRGIRRRARLASVTRYARRPPTSICIARNVCVLRLRTWAHVPSLAFVRPFRSSRRACRSRK